jgi:dephospho-CoA kinase
VTLKIGLTGSIASGKSTLLKTFGALGVPVFSSDTAVHELYRGAAVGPVGAAFPGVVRDGQVDRAALSAQLVADPARLATLEQIVHPLVRARIAAFLAKAEQGGAALAVVDIPLLYEGGHDYGLDRVIATVADETTLRRRALGRPGMTVEKLATILARQLPQDEKRRRADYIVDTSGPVEASQAWVARFVAELTQREEPDQ